MLPRSRIRDTNGFRGKLAIPSFGMVNSCLHNGHGTFSLGCFNCVRCSKHCRQKVCMHGKVRGLLHLSKQMEHCAKDFSSSIILSFGNVICRRAEQPIREVVQVLRLQIQVRLAEFGHKNMYFGHKCKYGCNHISIENKS